MVFGYTGIVIQTISIIAVYALAYGVFGRSVAIITASILVFNKELIEQALTLWQPFVVIVFINLCYLSLFAAHQKKSILLLGAAALCMSFALIFGYHAIALLPIMVVWIWAEAKRMRATFWYSVALTLILLLPAVFAYAPVAQHLTRAESAALLYEPSVRLTSSVSIYMGRISENVLLLLRGFFYNDALGSLLSGAVALGFLASIFITLVATKRIFALLLTLPILWTIGTAALLTKSQPWHFVGAVAPAVLIFASAIQTIFEKTNASKFWRIILVIIIVVLFGVPSSGYIQKNWTIQNTMPHLEAITDRIQKDVHGHIDVASYDIVHGKTTNYLAFWARLEEKLGYQLATIDWYKPIEYYAHPRDLPTETMYFICTGSETRKALQVCQGLFRSYYPSFQRQKLFYAWGDVPVYVVFKGER